MKSCGCGSLSLTRSGHSRQFFAHFHHAGGSASGVDASVLFGAKATRVRLFVGLDEEHFVNDGSIELQGKLKQTVGDRVGDELGVGGFAFQNQTQADDGGRFFVLQHQLGSERNFEGSGNANQVHAGTGNDRGKFVDSRLHQSVGVFLVELSCYDGELVATSGRNTRFWWDRETHERPQVKRRGGGLVK